MLQRHYHRSITGFLGLVACTTLIWACMGHRPGCLPRKPMQPDQSHKVMTAPDSINTVNVAMENETYTQKNADRDSFLTLQVQAAYLRAGSEMTLEHGISLSSRDNYALALPADQPCYVYVFQFDAKTTPTLLFPNPVFSPEASPIGPKKSMRIPAARQGWFFLDNNSGEEELLVLAYPKPMPDPLYVSLRLAGRYE